MIDYKDKYIDLESNITIYITGRPIGNNTSAEDLFNILKDEISLDQKDRFLFNIINNEWSGGYGVYIEMNDTVFCFTDPQGIEQLYYTVSGNKISVEPYLARLNKGELDKQYFSEICKWGYNTDNRTPWKNIKRVMPGKLLVYTDGTVGEVEIFDDYFIDSNETKSLKQLIETSVLKQLSSIEKQDSIGVLLSGGLDSCCIAYELLQLQQNNVLGETKLNFYTINNSEDEPFVKIFEDKFGIKSKRLSYDMDSIDIDKALLINETPVDLGSMVPNQIMFDSIPETVIFTGDGPDELFGGYRRIDEYDSQYSDVFEELSFYHFPRLNKAAHYFSKVLCCPYTDHSIVSRALATPLSERTHKKCLKDAYRGIIPDEILDRKKLPLKNNELRNSPMEYRLKLVDKFLNINS